MGAEFDGTDELRGARFTGVNLAGARFRDVDMRGVKISDALLIDADISGLITGLRINEVEVAPLIEAELDRRHPERVGLRATDPDGIKRAWSMLEQHWEATLERARKLPEARLHQRVDEEWSFVETLRHLVFATDAWIRRPVLGEARPYHPLGLPQTGFGSGAWLGLDADAAPHLDDVLVARADRQRTVRAVVENLTEAELARVCEQNRAPGYPPNTQVPVSLCVHVVLDEEWSHHQYAVRDLARMEAAGSSG